MVAHAATIINTSYCQVPEMDLNETLFYRILNPLSIRVHFSKSSFLSTLCIEMAVFDNTTCIKEYVVLFLCGKKKFIQELKGAYLALFLPPLTTPL